MTKAPTAFRSIGEVARLVGIAPHVLRYWQTQFPALVPVTRADGRRYYRPDDIALIAGISQALRDDGLTIRGANKLISQDKGAALRAKGAAWLGRTAGQPLEITSAGSGGQRRRIVKQNASGQSAAGKASAADGASASGTLQQPLRSHNNLSNAQGVVDRPAQAAPPRGRGARTGGFGAADAAGPAAATLPLFPDLAPPPQPCLLERLNGTLCRLRSTEAALPAEAAILAADLRRALHARVRVESDLSP